MRRTAVAAAVDQAVHQLVMVDMQGRIQAGWLANRLAGGQPPPVAPGTAPNGEQVWLNAVCDVYSWDVVEVVPRQRPVAAFGSPLFVAAAVALGTAANRREQRRAQAMSGPQWRSHGQAQVLVSATGTWLA